MRPCWNAGSRVAKDLDPSGFDGPLTLQRSSVWKAGARVMT